MKTGMMWFDNDPKKPLTRKIEEAADYYKKKFGQTPTTAFVSPKALGEEQVRVGGGILVESNGMRVNSMRAILPAHLWIGVEEAK